MFNKIKKYNVRKSSIYLVIILLIVCACAYVLCSYYLNLESIVANKNTSLNKIAKLQTVKDILLILISLFGANLLLGVIVEVQSKNALVTDIIINDVISAPEFYNMLPDTKKTSMYNALEYTLFFKNEITHNMYQNIREKLLSNVNEYYFCKCDFVVSCNIYDTYIEKEITRKLSIKSYDSNFTIAKYSFGRFKSKTISGLNSCEIKSIKINDEKIDTCDYMIKNNGKMCNLDEQNQYNSYTEYIYKKPLKISNKDETIIYVKYITRTAIDDRISTFRVGKPCKNFSLIYSVKQHDKYRIVVDAFGFLDNADDSANNSSNSNVNICFSDWIFRYDGVTVAILDK